MSTHIIRLLISDWDRAVEAIREQGAGFYWDHRNPSGEPTASWATEYRGALTPCASGREFDAGEWYRHLRKQLAAGARFQCDAHFGRLFRVEGHDVRLADLEYAPTGEEVRSALAPTSVMEQLIEARSLPSAQLRSASDHGDVGPFRYLPTFADFEHQLNNHKVALAFAAKRGLGMVSILSQ